MLIPESTTLETRVLLLAPIGNDASVTKRLLESAGIAGFCCADMEELLSEFKRGCAALLIAEEALGDVSLRRLSHALLAQPSWSDVPVIIVSTRAESSAPVHKRLTRLSPAGNIAILERPFRPLTVMNAVQVAVRARQRQFQVRALMLERERILADLERNVERRTEELRDTNSQLEEFVYSIAHDLRAPLRSMQGFASLLVEQYSDLLPEEGKNYAKKIFRSAEAMDAITLDLLSYGKLARSEIVLGPVRVEVAWTAAVFQCEKLIEEKEAKVEAVEPLPIVHAQTATLTQVLANLLNNALKFSRLGEPPRICFHAEEQGEFVRLWIEDNGIGIPCQYLDRIFRVFERLNGSKYQGTGIGLSIVRKGVERMGGKVGVVSEVGQGSRFWIDLRKCPGESRSHASRI